MTGTLNNQAAFVTGASRGIGRAIALSLARAGADVAVVSRNPEACESVCAEIRALGRKAAACPADVSDAGAVKSAVNKAIDEFGRLDIAVNNAGVARDGLIIRMSDDQWSEVLRINLLGTIYVTEAVMPHLLERGGSIVNIASVAGLRGNAGQVNYSAAKAGVIGYTRTIAPEYARKGIRVNCIVPGLIDTELTSGYSERLKAEGRSRVALGRFGTAEEIAPIVTFLCGPEASYIVGAVIEAHGGLDA